MLTENNYTKGNAVIELIKHNIDYNKKPLFDIVRAGIASRLLQHQYASGLTDEQKEILNNIATN